LGPSDAAHDVPAQSVAGGGAVPAASGAAGAGGNAARTKAQPAKAGREAKKELTGVERRLERLRAEADQVGAELALTDPSDWEAVGRFADRLAELGAAIANGEERWLELAEAAGL
jgi:hypothetical protein